MDRLGEGGVGTRGEMDRLGKGEGAGRCVEGGAGRLGEGGVGRHVEEGAGRCVEGGAGRHVEEGAGRLAVPYSSTLLVL